MDSVGGKLVSMALEDIMPKVAASALVGMGSGAISGATTAAVGYGMSCGSSKDGCSLSGAGSAVGDGAMWGGLIGGLFGGLAPGKTSAAPAEADAGGAAGEPAGEPAAGKEEESSPACKIHSFVGSTGVLMADGSSKPISQVKVGDQVGDSVPGDATLESHTVQKVIVAQTDRDFVDVSIKKLATKLGQAAAGLALAAATTLGAAGPASAAPADASTLTTTYHHPFYDVTRSAFVDAVDLHAGDQLQTADGATAAVTAVRAYHKTEVTYDLTIDGLHTYYVDAGDTAVLVHNCTKATFVADTNGTVIPTSAARLEGGFQAAVDAGEPGFSTFPTRSEELVTNCRTVVGCE